MIFVTNDDGIESEGLKKLAEALKSLDIVYIVAPDRERSAISMAITLDRPVSVKKIDKYTFATGGTPVDCVYLAIGDLLPERPKLLVSGINNGQNLGHDIHFSGTVSAAIAGTFMGIPSIAISLPYSRRSYHYETATHIALRIAKAVLRYGLPRGILLNVNVPNRPLSEIKGIEITRQDKAAYKSKVTKKPNPGSVEYYWIGGPRENSDDREGTDIDAVRNDKVSITPLQLDFTDYDMMGKIADWEL